MLEETKRPPSADTPPKQPTDKQWQSLEAFTEDEQFIEVMKQHFPREAAVLKRAGKMSRRQFINLMGASLVMGGLSLTGCAPAARDHEQILPFARMPETVVPGKPLFFASTMVIGGYGTGVLIETHAGRPTRIDGNPNHPASLGASSIYQLASILELYNPSRSTGVRHNDVVSTWDEFLADFERVRASLGSGRGLRILTETVTSPTLAAQIKALLEQYPDARWYQYDPVNRTNVLQGAQIAFGEAVETVYDFSRADVVLALDADFLTAMPGSLRYARDFTAKRKVHEASGTPTMNRLYTVESTPTSTGAVADHRLSLRASQVGSFILALADALGVEGGQPVADAPWDAAWLGAVAEDLQANSGASVVVVGDEQPAAVHALAHAINAALNSVGSTVTYLPPLMPEPVNVYDQLAALTADMLSGVQALFILGGNPVYSAPADVDFAGALARVPFSVHLSSYNDETSQRSTWHVPMSHYAEGWGDARAYDGTASIIQPPILPLYSSSRSDGEMLALIAEDARSGYEIVRDYWQSQYSGSDFDSYWRRTLHDGVVPDSAPAPISPTLNSAEVATAAAALATSSSDLEIIFRPHPCVYDGRFAFNGWLQELPHPLTKLTWDNVAMLGAATARQLGVRNGDLLELTYQGRTTQAPAWIVPGHAEGAVTLPMGYGRGLGGDVEAGLSFNAFAIRTAATPDFGAGLQVRALGRQYRLALVQKEVSARGTDPVRMGTLAEFITNPDFAHEGHKKYDATFLSEYDYAGYAWGMTIDLTSCIGCNACVVACQSENSIPVVGKAEVLQEREMHWLRVDRYYEEDGSTRFQPLPCMHCENAPCEQVCPVQATVHDHEGLNLMVYNRCVGTRACSANCPYSVRRFNFLDYIEDAPSLIELRNPNVSVRERGVMEKCTYCVQRINAARVTAGVEDRRLLDGEVVTACAAACPTQAIKFGNINDPNAVVSREKAQPHNYGLLEELNTIPRTSYLARLTNPNAALVAGAATEEG